MIRRVFAIGICVLVAACATRSPQSMLPVAPPSGEPPGLTGIGEAVLRASFGAPSFERKDATTEILRYDGRSCRAFFFLYPDADGALIVRHVETLPRGATMAADTTCLDALRVPAKVS